MSSFLVLWDVDYTLVNAHGVGWRLYELAFAQLYGRELPLSASEANMAGRTDLAIARDVLESAGIPDPDAQVSVFEAALTRLAPGVAELAVANAVALPGAATAIKALAELGVRQSLVTGNVRALAEVKLAPLGLTEHLDLTVGGYGNESAVRSDLVHLARARATDAYGTDFAGEATVVVGDTPLDVSAALAAGARAVGVATGAFTVGDLAGSGAHAMLADLTDSAEVMAAVLGAFYQPRPA